MKFNIYCDYADRNCTCSEITQNVRFHSVGGSIQGYKYDPALHISGAHYLTLHISALHNLAL
jgi:hypothetical protein